MRGIVFHGKGDIRYEESYPEPQIQNADEVKLKVSYCGICGSDLHEYLDGPIFFKDARNEVSNKPNVQCMGHEMSGEIVEIGSNVKSLKVGDKVVVDATGTCLDRVRFPGTPNFKNKPCGSCADGIYNACDHIGFTGLGFADGGFADYCVVGESHAIRYPDTIPDDVAALTEPLAVAWHAVRTSHIDSKGSALVLGAGPIGLGTIFALKGHQVQKIVVVEPSLARRNLARKFGVEVFDPSGFNSVEETVTQLRKLSNNGYGFSHSYDCSGIPATFNMSVQALKANGVSTNLAIWPHKAINFFPMDLTLHEKYLTGSMCYVRKDFEEVIQAYEQGLLNPHEVSELITSVIPLKDGIEKGFKELVFHKDKHIKILFAVNGKV
ncbi:uncharacterized protein PRCAT00003542001 [Priceomyces carsonii]|uniref:uncharacterized protein n=1 Tax=Priceomyces carsonii TaxID=28549 RepID=UPI002ED94A70|nr:unnamed protein product [Priceomyces carsonii]